jgi:hypothetical protein
VPPREGSGDAREIVISVSSQLELDSLIILDLRTAVLQRSFAFPPAELLPRVNRREIAPHSGQNR